MKAAVALTTRLGHANAMPVDMMLAAIPSLPRAVLSRLVSDMIDRLDAIDGDPDLEAAGDELDGSMGEDDFHWHSANWLGYPGDPSDAEDDDPAECEARDDGCGPIALRGRIVWGSEWEEQAC